MKLIGLIVIIIILILARFSAKKQSERYELEREHEYYETNIAGINFRNLDDSYIGEFRGRIEIEDDNPYDPLAVAIFVGKKKVGYIPKEDNRLIYRKLVNLGGQKACSGFIAVGTDEEDGHKFYYGKIRFFF